MVKKGKIFFGLAGMVAIVVVVLASIRTRISDGEHNLAISLKTALGVFHDQHGRYPPSLNEVEPVLREVTGAKCQVVQNAVTESYTVKIVSGNFAFQGDVDYRTGAGGNLEILHVKNVHRFNPDN